MAAPLTEPLASTSGHLEAGVAGSAAAALTAMFTQDGELLPPNRAHIEGRAAIQEFLKAFMAAEVTAQHMVLSSRVQDELGVKSGDYVIRDCAG